MLLRILLLLLAGTAAPALAETRAGDTVTIGGLVEDDLFAAGARVRVSGAVAGDATIGAGTLDVDGDLEGDGLLAAYRMVLAGGVGDDLRAVAGDLTLGGFVIDHAVIAAGNVTLTPDSAIGGRTWIAAGHLEAGGQVGDDLRVVADTAVISGQVDGNVEITARRIRVAPGAVINGELVWRSEAPPEIAEDAEIMGGVVSAADVDDAANAPLPAGPVPGIALGLAWFVAALVLLWLRPVLVSRAAAVFAAAPGRTLLLGVATLVLAPLGAVVLFVTLLGWLLGLLLLAAFLFALVLAAVLGLLMLVQLVAGRIRGAGQPDVAPGAGGWRSVALLAAFTAGVVALQGVPVLGSVVNGLLLLAGLGSLAALATGRAAAQSGPVASSSMRSFP